MLRWIGTLAVMMLVAGAVYGGMLFLLPSVIQVAGLGAVSGVPSAINHQGVVTVSGKRFSGLGQFKFAIVDPDTGNNVWTNDGSKVVPPDQTGQPDSGVSLTVTDGVYSTILGAGPMSTIPTSLFADGNLVLRVWFNDGTHNWQQLSPDQVFASVPYALRAADAGIVGEIKMWGGSAINLPAGWLTCDGSSLSTTAYPNLFAAIGYSYCGSGSSFNLPDLRGRTAVGLGTHADVNAVGDNDGIAVASRRPNHVHTIAAHKHSKGSLSISGGSHRHSLPLMNDGCMSGCSGWGYGDQAARSTGGSVDSTNFFTPPSTHTHPNSEFSGVVGKTDGVDGDANIESSAMGPAYLTINYIIKY